MDLCDQGIIPTITGLILVFLSEESSDLMFVGCLREISEEDTMGKTTIDLDIISDSLFILSCFGETDIHRKVRTTILIYHDKATVF